MLPTISNTQERVQYSFDRKVLLKQALLNSTETAFFFCNFCSKTAVMPLQCFTSLF